MCSGKGMRLRGGGDVVLTADCLVSRCNGWLAKRQSL